MEDLQSCIVSEDAVGPPTTLSVEGRNKAPAAWGTPMQEYLWSSAIKYQRVFTTKFKNTFGLAEAFFTRYNCL